MMNYNPNHPNHSKDALLQSKKQFINFILNSFYVIEFDVSLGVVPLLSLTVTRQKRGHGKTGDNLVAAPGPVEGVYRQVNNTRIL